MKQTVIETDYDFLSMDYNTDSDQLYGTKSFIVTLLDIGDEPSDNLNVVIDHDPLLDVTPDELEMIIGEPQTVFVRYPDYTDELGDYNFALKLTNEYAEDKIVTSAISFNNKTIPPTPDYKLKYYIERTGYRLNIYENTLSTLIPLEINGTADISKQDRKDLNDPVISTTLKIKLEASLDLTFEDLYSESEKTFKVEVIKDSKILFLGFIIPDGIWEDFVNDKWILDITATDSLPTLNKISFSNDNGINFFGRMKMIKAIDICLKKTGINLPILINCEVKYNGLSTFVNIFDSVNISVERYFQNKDVPMDCLSVLNSLLNTFNCSLVQYDGQWIIYKTIDLRKDLKLGKFIDGIFNSNYSLLNNEYLIGSEINGHTIFHCSANQKKTIFPSVQAYQITYEYGESKNVLTNGGLKLEGAGLNIPGWNVFNPDGGVARGFSVGDDYGLRGSVKSFDPPEFLLTTNQDVNLKANQNVKVSLRYKNIYQNSRYLYFAFGVYNVPTATSYWYDRDLNGGSFSTSYKVNVIHNAYESPVGSGTFFGLGVATFEFEASLPVDGGAVFQIYRDSHGAGGTFGIGGVSLSAGSANIKNKEYKGRRIQKTSTSTKDTITVYNGDSESVLFVGSLFKADSVTPTSKWNRYKDTWNGTSFVRSEITEQKEILEINVEENLIASPRPMIGFEGDFKGYIPYIGLIKLDGFTDKEFQFIKYSYSLDNDITKMMLKEFSNDIIPDNDFKVDIIENYGNETKVLILN